MEYQLTLCEFFEIIIAQMGKTFKAAALRFCLERAIMGAIH
jgi:hypothetical protein